MSKNSKKKNKVRSAEVSVKNSAKVSEMVSDNFSKALAESVSEVIEEGPVPTKDLSKEIKEVQKKLEDDNIFEFEDLDDDDTSDFLMPGETESDAGKEAEDNGEGEDSGEETEIEAEADAEVEAERCSKKDAKDEKTGNEASKEPNFFGKLKKKVVSAFETEEKKEKAIKYIGLGLVAFFMLSVVALTWVVTITGFIPGFYIALFAIALLLLGGIFALLQEWFIPGMVGKILSVFLGVIFVVGCVYLGKTYKALKSVTGIEVQTNNIQVYTLESLGVKSLEETDGLTYGILSFIDRYNTDKALEEIRQKVNIDLVEYATISSLVAALKTGAVDAIVLNSAYISLASGIEGLESITEELASLYEVNVVSKVEEDDPTLPPKVSSTPTPAGPTATLAPDQTATPAPTDEPTPTPYTGLAFTFDGMVIDKSDYLYGNNNIFAAYLSGIDTYGSPDYVSRSDVNILVVVNMNTKKVLMINTPRDYYVVISGANMRDKLTHAGACGIKTSINTLQMLYGVNIDYYAKVNFTGFVNVIDSLGGIDVYSDYDFLYFTQGINHLNGATALTFARERYSFPGGDRQRGKNQMAVVQAIINKLISTDALLNFDALLASLNGCVVTNMQYDRMSELVRYQIGYGGGWDIETYSVNGSDGWDIGYLMESPNYVMIPDMSTVDTARSKIRAMYGY